MTWWWKRTQRPDRLERATEQLAEAQQQRDEIAAMRPETERLAKRNAEHLRDNHFAERFAAGVLATQRGRHA